MMDYGIVMTVEVIRYPDRRLVIRMSTESLQRMNGITVYFYIS